MHPRLCEKAGKHSGRHIEAFCLEDSCKKHRLLCFFCVFESHSNHKIAYLHRELGGAISNLDQQIHVRSKEHSTSQDKMEETFNKITKACERLARASTTKVTIIKNLLNPQIQAIRKSFKKNSVDEIIKDLTSNHHITNEKLERYARILLFYDKNGMNDLGNIQKNSEKILETLNQLVNDALKKIETIFNGLLTAVEKFDISKDFSEFIEPSQPEKYAESSDKRIQDIQQQKSHQHFPRRLQKINHPDVNHSPCNMVSPQEERIDPENENFIFNIKTPNKDLIPQEMPLKDLSSDDMVEENISESSHLIKEVGNGYLMTGRQKQIPFSDCFSQISLWSPPKNISPPPLAKLDRSRRNNPQEVPHIENVHIYSATTSDLNKMLSKINYYNIKSLVIKCDTRLNILDELSVEMISKMVNLVSLKIYLAKELSESLAIDMVKPLGKLQELVLAEFSDLSIRFIETLKKYNANLNRVCFTFDLGRLKDAEEMLEFLPDIAEGIREQRYWEALTNSSLMLQNIELQNIRNLQYWITYVKNISSYLKEVTIIDSTTKKVDYTQLFHALSKCKNLEYLRLELLEFDEESLIEIIINNPNLKHFVLSECNCITQRLYKFICKYSSNLKAFSLSLEDVFNGRYMFATKNLESLVLRACYGVNDIQFPITLRNWKKLKCITIDYASCWVTQGTLREITRLNHLQVLNISNTKLKSIGCALDSLKRLDTFICSNSDLSYEKIGTFMFARKLQKLSISGVTDHGQLEDIDVGKVAYLFPKLTHLKLVNFRSVVGDTWKLNYLSSLVSMIVGKMAKKDVELLYQYCKGRDINFIVLEQS